jgi:hypothetical protein
MPPLVARWARQGARSWVRPSALRHSRSRVVSGLALTLITRKRRTATAVWALDQCAAAVVGSGLVEAALHPGPDPRLVALREQLAAARARGESFQVAWAAGLASIPRARIGRERMLRDGVIRALDATREHWERAYERAPAARVDRAVAELEGYATDGELAALRPVA